MLQEIKIFFSILRNLYFSKFLNFPGYARIRNFTTLILAAIAVSVTLETLLESEPSEKINNEQAPVSQATSEPLDDAEEKPMETCPRDDEKANMVRVITSGFFYGIFVFFTPTFLHFLQHNFFCIFYTKIFAFFAPKFLHFCTFLHQHFFTFLHQHFLHFLHQNCCIFYTKLFAFFYTTIFALLD